MDAQITELVQRVLQEFRERCETDPVLQGLREKAAAGTVTYEEAMQYASRVAQISSDACNQFLLQGYRLGSTEEDGGRISPLASLGRNDRDEQWREAFRALTPASLDRNYELVAQYCGLTQAALNKKAGLGLNAVKPANDLDRAEGITKHVTSAEDPAQAAARLTTDTESYDRHTVDESVRQNADFHYRSGVRATIQRIADPGCCAWCSGLAGTYDYAQVRRAGNDVWRRHANCGCLILYDPGNGTGKVQVDNYARNRKERLHPDAERELAAKRASVPAGHADAAPEKLRERTELPGGHPDVTPGGKTLDISGNGGILKTENIVLTPVTEDSIRQLKVPQITGFSKEVCERFYEAEKELLQEVQKLELGTEVAKICDLSGSVIDSIIGPSGKGNSNIPNYDFAHFVFHNHPDNRIFSGKDIETFIMRDTITGIAAIGNDGSSLYVISKRSDYDGMSAWMAFDAIQPELKDAVVTGDIGKYISVMEDFLKGAESLGITYDTGNP